MKIILKGDINNLGYKDDVVEVKSGYGRNYLIPQGKAVIASESALKVLAENQRQRAHKLAKIKADAEAVAESLKDVALTLTAKVSNKGTIYGSITNIQIAEALEKLGHNIDRKIIVVKNQVKELGKYEAIVKLHKEVSAVIPFEVVAEAEPEAEVEATPAEWYLTKYIRNKLKPSIRVALIIIYMMLMLGLLDLLQTYGV